jgi:transcriptional regulator with XRE-family HTH domain
MSFYFTKQLRENVGKKIRKARRNKGLKQVEVAVEAGMSPSYYGKIERGVVNPSLEKLHKIIKSLGVKSSDILPF